MTARRLYLTEEDLQRLIRSDVAEERAIQAHKLCRSMERLSLNDEGRAAAHKIISIVAADSAELVRRALAVTLRGSDLLPLTVARQLVADVDSIAVPVITNSPVFSDAELIEILNKGNVAHQIAVASRQRVSRDVADVVANRGGVEAVRALAANDNADVSEGAMCIAFDRFGGDAAMVEALALRRILPPSVVERLMSVATDALRAYLVDHHAVPMRDAVRITDHVRERATVDLIDTGASVEDLEAFVTGLQVRNALTGSLLLRALARGQMGLFEHGVGLLACVPHHRAWLMVHDAGPLGFRAIYDRAGLPPRLFNAYRAGVETWRMLHAEGREIRPETFRHLMLERFLTTSTTVAREDMDYLLERLEIDHPLPVRPREAWVRETWGQVA